MNTKQKNLDLNDVLSFVRKANRLEKRAIDLALEKNTEFAVEISYKRGKIIPENVLAEEEFFLELHAEYMETGKLPGNMKIERRICYGS